jgi:hypothetical protein
MHETPAQQGSRLLSALEDLARQERAALGAQDFAGLAAVQERIAPVIEHLAGKLGSAALAPWRDRIARLRDWRAETARQLDAALARTRAALQETHAVRRRVAQVAPAYGRPRPAGPQVALVG